MYDRISDVRRAWLKGRPCASPTALEGLASCPFRSLAERVWALRSVDAAGRLSMTVGTLAHRVLEEVLAPFVGLKDWPSAFLEALGVTPEVGAEAVLPHLLALWDANRDTWLDPIGRRHPPGAMAAGHSGPGGPAAQSGSGPADRCPGRGTYPP